MQKISDKKLVAKFSGITPVEQKCQKSAKKYHCGGWGWLFNAYSMSGGATRSAAPRSAACGNIELLWLFYLNLNVFLFVIILCEGLLSQAFDLQQFSCPQKGL